jgi:hypothetical protein
MRRQVEHRCDEHFPQSTCPDVLVAYSAKFDEYGIVVHDGGSSSVRIAFCPWCGQSLPASRRGQWFEELKRLGFDNPLDQNIPEAYLSEAWYARGQG